MAEFTKGASTPRTEMLRALMALYVQVPEEVACDVERCFAAYDAKCGEMLEALEHLEFELIGLYCYLETCSPDVIISNLPSTIARMKYAKGLAERVIREARGEREKHG